MSWRDRVVRLDERQLQASVDVLRRFTGLRLELPPPSCPLPHAAAGRCGKQLAVVRRLGAQLRCRSGVQGRVVLEGVLLDGGALDDVRAESTAEGASRFTPDMVVCSADFLDSERRSLHPQAVDIVVEVVTPDASDARVAEAVARYAAARVPLLLVVDPRPRAPAAAPDRRSSPAPPGGRWALYAAPVGRAYWRKTVGAYGEPVPLPEPLSLALSTDGLPAYGPYGSCAG
ncbi:Uma2 family endonuclease [Streptomyces oceani]|uniref:Uma2 family endonuclease n=1 Tax=Streptomyces oceani TaxID=1075402 RepID=UPI000871DAC0|nr:Uma2 family endonuclease [Streptomyces oceani]